MDQLLQWCMAEQAKLKRRIAELEADGGAGSAAEIKLTKKHLASLEVVLLRLRSGAPNGTDRH
jgi:hypothetical protein